MVYSDKFYVGFSDVDSRLLMTNTAILRVFEDVCCMQGEAVGDGFSDSDGRWFLTAYHVKVFSRPKYNERVFAGTWSRGMKGVAASREFELRDAEGNLLVAALSNWARMNISTGRLERMDAESFAKYESEPERHNFPELWIQKLREVSEPQSEREFYVDRRLIDPNMHMNNIRYLELAELMLPDEVFLTGGADEFEITFRKATACGETLVCQYSEDADSRTVAVVPKDRSDTRAIVKMYI